LLHIIFAAYLLHTGSQRQSRGLNADYSVS